LVALVGLEGRIVEVEADIGAGLPCTVLSGISGPDPLSGVIIVKAAVSNLTINLSPDTVPKARHW
jgi:magnesium chelatase family protein